MDWPSFKWILLILCIVFLIVVIVTWICVAQQADPARSRHSSTRRQNPTPLRSGQDHKRLHPIWWFEQRFDMTIRRRIVSIDGKRCRILTSDDDMLPGSFGIRMEVGSQSHVLLDNELPFETKDTCMCDAAMDMMPPTNTNPCWTNLHFHGFWGSAAQDDVYACVKPTEKRLYSYDMNPNHPTGIYIEHVHNFSSSVTQDHITPFIITVYNKRRPDYPRHIRQVTLFIMLAYMQTCPPDDPDRCEVESFDFPKYASGDFNTYAALLQAGPKLLLVNGQVEPFEVFSTHTPVILRIGWMGILDILRFRIIDDETNVPVSFRILSIDSLPIAGQCSDKKDNVMILSEFVAAHMQRFDVMVIFSKKGKYRLLKYTTTDDDTSPFSVPTRTMMTIHAVDDDDDKCDKHNPDQDCLLSDLRLRNPYWVKQVNRRFRNLGNLAAWRTVRFNYPQFPDIEGSMFDLTVLPAQMVMVANKSEVWLVGSASGLHSLHIHLQWFLIMAERPTENDQWTMIPKEKQWFQDTLVLESGRQFLVWMFPFADRKVHKKDQATGLAMVHCHMSDHTDAMMMLTLLVSDDETTVPSGVGLVHGAQSPQILEITRQSSCRRDDECDIEEEEDDS